MHMYSNKPWVPGCFFHFSVVQKTFLPPATHSADLLQALRKQRVTVKNKLQSRWSWSLFSWETGGFQRRVRVIEDCHNNDIQPASWKVEDRKATSI